MVRWFLALSLLIASAVHAGETTAVITGVVTHSDGRPAVHVEVQSGETSATTNERGEFRMLVTPGEQWVKSGGDYARFVVAPGETTAVRLNYERTPEFIVPGRIDDREHAFVEVPLQQIDLMRLPFGRTLDDVTRLAPGALDTTFGRSVAGSFPNGNASFIDGVESPEFPGVQLPLEFYGSVNMLTIGQPAEYGRVTGGLLLATTPSPSRSQTSAFVYFQPRRSSTRGVTTTATRHWDAGFTTSLRFNERLWFFAGYDRLTDDYDSRGLGTFHDHSTVDAMLAKLEWTATPSARVILEGFGDPSRAKFDTGGAGDVFHSGTASGSLRGFANGMDWVADGGVSHSSLTKFEFAVPHSSRVDANVQRMFAGHVLRGGAEYAREPGVVQFAINDGPRVVRPEYTAAYLGDTWYAKQNLVIDAGLRREWAQNGNWLPRASAVWTPSRDVRLFATYGRYTDDSLRTNPFLGRQKMHEVSAGAELETMYRLSAHLVRRTIEGRNLNGALVEMYGDVTRVRIRISDFIARSDDGYADVYRDTPERRHQLTAYASMPIGLFEVGAIVTRPDQFVTSVHLGLRLNKVTLVADVMNVTERDEARTIRFGLRAAL